MSQRVFVIHGVKNHVEENFKKRVVSLGNLVSGLELVPVFWGDLGGHDEWLDQVIPSGGDGADVRGGEPVSGTPTGVAPLEAMLLAGQMSSGEVVRSDEVDGKPILVQQAASGPNPLDEADWREVVAEVWDETPHLRAISDEALLRELADIVATPPPDGVGPAAGTTATPGPDGSTFDTRGPITAIKNWYKQRLRDIDGAVSAVVGSAAGKVNESLRTKAAPDIAQFAGDIAVYQRNPQTIHDRVREVLGTKHGTAANPARFIAHSLGGVITLDMCVNQENPLHVQGLVTFGSQWPLFQLVDPRAGVDQFGGTNKVKLPASLTGRWINLWEPLDPLAFVASHVFRLADDGTPDDRRAQYQVKSGLWTHSAYWHLPELFAAIRDVFN